MKYKAAAVSLGLAAVGVWGAAGARLLSAQGGAQQKAPIVREVQAHVYRPTPLPATSARVAALQAPPGFAVAKWAEGMENPRMIAVAPDGTTYVSQRKPGNVLMLRDTDGDGKADVKRVVARREMAHGLALRGNKLYLVTVNEVLVAERKGDGTLGPLRVLVDDLPEAGQHPNRTLAFGPDGYLYVSVGSSCNACDETSQEYATILRMRPDGSDRTIHASGLRNTIGFGWHPATRELWGLDHGIDWLGDDEQQEELNRIEAGRRYGWPYVYGEGKQNPADSPPEPFTYATWAKTSREPVLQYTAHSAPLQMTFYTGNSFPAEYRGDAFVAMRGSWNRLPPSGYEVARVVFDPQGRPERIEPFVKGWLVEEGGQFAHFGRLAGCAMLPDGSLLVGDDENGVLYRIRYTGRGSTTK